MCLSCKIGRRPPSALPITGSLLTGNSGYCDLMAFESEHGLHWRSFHFGNISSGH